MTVDIRASLRASRLIPQGTEIYNRVLTSVILKELKLVNIREQTQDLTIKLPSRFWGGKYGKLIPTKYQYHYLDPFRSFPQLLRIVQAPEHRAEL